MYLTTVNSNRGSNSDMKSAAFFHTAGRLYQWKCRKVDKGNKVTLARSEPCLLCIGVSTNMKQCYQMPISTLQQYELCFFRHPYLLSLPHPKRCFSLTVPIDLCSCPGLNGLGKFGQGKSLNGWIAPSLLYMTIHSLPASPPQGFWTQNTCRNHLVYCWNTAPEPAGTQHCWSISFHQLKSWIQLMAGPSKLSFREDTQGLLP